MPLRDLRCLKCFEITPDIFFHREDDLRNWTCPKCGAVGEFEMMLPKIADPRVKDGTPKFYPRGKK